MKRHIDVVIDGQGLIVSAHHGGAGQSKILLTVGELDVRTDEEVTRLVAKAVGVEVAKALADRHGGA